MKCQAACAACACARWTWTPLISFPPANPSIWLISLFRYMCVQRAAKPAISAGLRAGHGTARCPSRCPAVHSKTPRCRGGAVRSTHVRAATRVARGPALVGYRLGCSASLPPAPDQCHRPIARSSGRREMIAAVRPRRALSYRRCTEETERRAAGPSFA